MKKGFTLIELLVAMAIIGILIGMTVFGISRAFRASRDTQRQNLLREIQTAIIAYQGQTRKIPTFSQITQASEGAPVLVGTGTKQESVATEFLVVKSASKPTATKPADNQALICYDTSVTSGNGYALAVMLDDGTMFYMTGEKGSCG